MALLLTSHGVRRAGLLGGIHHAIETSTPMRTAAITATAAAAGLAAGRSRKARKLPPAAVAASGVVLSFFGFSGIGDGLVEIGRASCRVTVYIWVVAL